MNWLSARNGFTKVGCQWKTGAFSRKNGVAQKRLWLNGTVADLWRTVAKAGLTQILKAEINVISGPIDEIVW